MTRYTLPGLLLGALIATGCQAALPLRAGLEARLAMDAGFHNLVQSGARDWQSGVVTSPELAQARQAHVEASRRQRAGLQGLAGSLPSYRLQTAYPTAPANWRTGSPSWPGISISDLNSAQIATNDPPPNGLAASIYWNNNQHIFLLTNNGRLVRVGANDPSGTAATINLDSRTFSRTALALNPTCSRLYALSDLGYFFIVNVASNTMSILNPLSTDVEGSSAKFLAPLVDPILSAPDGSKDVVWVPLNNGRVYKYVVTNTGTTSSFPSPTLYEVVPSTVTPTVTNAEILNGYRLAAPITGLGGRLFACDTAGTLHDYDTTTGTAVRYPLSSTMGIMAPAALEVSDGSSDFQGMKTHTGTTTNPGFFQPVYAFVNVLRDAGPTCAWVNLVERTVHFSRPTFVDDNDANGTRRVYGNPHEYDYADGADTDLTIKADATNGDAVTSVVTSGDTLPGGNPFLTTSLVPATTGATGSNGGTLAFLRFSSSSIPNQSVITGAKLTLKASATVTTYPPRVYRVGSTAANGLGTDGIYQRGTTNTWTATATNQLDASTQPVLFNQARTDAMGGVAVTATTTFTSGSSYEFDVTPLLGGAIKQGQWAFALGYEGLPAGHTVVYPGGTVSGTNYAAPQFHNPRDGSNANVPTLTLTYKTLSSATHARPPATTPIIDATRKRVYCYDNNYLFCMNFTNPTTWTDTTRSSHNASGTPHTGYQAAYWGRQNGSYDAKADGTNPGYHRNWTNPAVAFDLSAIYVFSRAQRGSSSNGEIGLSRIVPNRTGNQTTGLDIGGTTSPAAGADRGTADTSSPCHSGSPNTLVMDPDPFGLTSVVSRYPVIDPYSNILSKGGDLFVGFQANSVNLMLRLGTD